ncbi:uncharacterized protein LOC117332980 [Pecten maximus]|uniref:uncharacterized protein LOC117332980 n=1 Tax=Pecten maximus TaxID=6579 RepID=UPI00145911A0|nr:uncharacterized protein LOC117332980 [Pecten maximus]
MRPTRQAVRNHTAIKRRRIENPPVESENSGADQTAVSTNSTLPMSEVQALMKEAFKQGVEEARRLYLPTTDSNVVNMDTNNADSATTTAASSGMTNFRTTTEDNALTTTTSSGTLTDHPVVTSQDSISRSSHSVLPAMTLAAVDSQADPTTDPNPFMSTSIPLADMVCLSIKEKIWAGEFVDLSTLSRKEPNTFEMVIRQNGTGSPVVQWVPKTKSKSLSIDQWTSLFHSFVAIYCQKKPQDFEALLKYMSVIRKLATKQADWAYYDSAFRHLMAEKESYHWEHVEWELWHEAMSRKAFANKNTSYPKGTCWRFLQGRFCSGCKFLHKCPYCNGDHTPNMCNVSQTQDTPFNPMPFRNERFPTPFHASRSRGFPRNRYTYHRR